MDVWNYIVDLFARVRGDFVGWLQDVELPGSLIVFLDALIGVTLMLMIVFPIVILLIWLERRVVAQFQIRPGPNRCGPFGLLQPIADAVKLMFKEFIAPAKGDRLVLWIAPVLVFFSVFMVFAVIPIGEGEMGALADLNIGILYIVAIGSIGVVGIFAAGWGSNNKYALLGAMRSIAQLVSYEVPMVLSIMGIVLMVGSLSLVEIVGQQSVPFILLQPLGFLIYLLGALAEMNRAPFDQVEADSELTAGFMTEYSGMRFGAFFLAEYINVVVVSTIITTLFLGGWKLPWGLAFPVWIFFMVKLLLVIGLILWMRATLVRVRIDQIMAFSWKFLIPVALINIFITAGEVLIWDQWMSGWETFPWPFMFANWAIAAVVVILWSKLFFKLGGGRVDVREIRARYSQGPGAGSQTSVPA